MKIVVGVDEAGIGTLAGPMIVVAAAFEENTQFSKGVKDSKKLNDTQREDLINEIYDFAKWIIIKRVPAAYINTRKNIWAAWDVAMRETLETCLERDEDNLDLCPFKIIVDGRRRIVGLTGISYEIRGDVWFKEVSAASIVAKYIQTLFMLDLHEKYPEFGFSYHKGYPAPYHLQTLAKRGPTKFHRFAYGPVKAALSNLSPKKRMEISQLDFTVGIKTSMLE